MASLAQRAVRLGRSAGLAVSVRGCRVFGVSSRAFGAAVSGPPVDLPPNLTVDGAARALLKLAAAAPPPPPPATSPTELPVVSFSTGQPTGAVVALDPRVFNTPLRPDIVHRVIVWQEKNARTTLYKAKTRAEVRGGGRKPWKQKGTGRARAGSIRSPLWRGGGVAHAPVFRDWSISLNKKVRQLGLRVALAAKARDGRLVVVDALSLASPRTRELERALGGPLRLPVGRKRLVLVDTDAALAPDGRVALAARNLPLTVPLPVRGVNVRDLVAADRVLVTVDGLAALTERVTRGLGPAPPPLPPAAATTGGL